MSPSKGPWPFPTNDHHLTPPGEVYVPKRTQPTEEAIDEGIEESFPASDPLAVTVSVTPTASKRKP